MASVKYAEKRLLSVLTATPCEEIGGKKVGGRGEGRGGLGDVLVWGKGRVVNRFPGFWLGPLDRWRSKWQPTLVFLPGERHGQRSLAGHSTWELQSRTGLKRLSTRRIEVLKGPRSGLETALQYNRRNLPPSGCDSHHAP